MNRTHARVGHDLTRAPDLVAARGSSLGRPMSLLAATTSTSDDAKRAAKDGAPHGSTWVAEEQSSGRGRHGRTWWSPPGEGLLFSILVRYDQPPARLPQVALVAGLAVHEAVVRAAPNARPRILLKWPNDVVVVGDGSGTTAHRKVAGVLVEAVTSGTRVEAVVIGIGINVHTRAFPDALAERSTSVALAASGGGQPPDRAEILADVLSALDRDLHVVAGRGLSLFRARLDAADSLRGRSVRCEDDTGVAQGIDDDGRLTVRRSDGVLARWTAGEVHLL